MLPRLPLLLVLAPAALTTGTASLAVAQGEPSGVDYTPELPPTATYPIFVDVAKTIGAPGTKFDDKGSGRGQVIADLLGPDPSDPTDPHKVGPPDGIPDILQLNSDSPALPLGAAPGTEEVLQIGSSFHASMLMRGELDGSYTDVARIVSPFDPLGYNIEYPGGSPWGAFAFDAEGDGDLDIFYANGGFNTDSPNTLMLNLGNGTFRNAAGAGITHFQDSYTAVALDYDLDGDLDIYVGNSAQANGWYVGNPMPDPTDLLYENQGAGTFIDVGAQAECNIKSNAFAATTADLDRNGWPDIVVSCYKQYNKVFYGKADGVFSFMAPATNPSKVMSLSDLVLDPVGTGTYDFASVPAGAEDELPLLGDRSMPVEVADFNGDKWPDVLFVSWTLQQPDLEPTGAEGAIFAPVDRACMYLNRGDEDGDGVGDGLFIESAKELGIDHIGGTMAMTVGHFNGDPYPDIYLGGGGPNIPYHNEEDYLYINEPTAWPANFQQDPDQPLGKAFWEIGALAGTYDNKFMSHGANAFFRNGRVDVVIGNGGPAVDDEGQSNTFWLNTGNADGLPYTITEVELNSVTSAPGAVGARVELIRDGDGGAHQTMIAERTAGARFGCHSAQPLNFGLGQGGLLYAGVTWPSGARQGEVLWALNPKPDRLQFTEKLFSLGLDADYPVGGGVNLTLSIEELGTDVHLVNLLFVVLTPVGGGLFLPALISSGGQHVIAPGPALELGGLVNPAPDGALIGIVAIDAVTGKILNAGAVWHEKALEPTPTPVSYDPPTPGVETASVFDRAVEAEHRFVLHADRVEISPARQPAEWRSLELDASGELRLDSGDRLSWSHGELKVLLKSRGLMESGPDGLFLITGVPASCCEQPVTELGSYLRFPADASLLSVDGL